MRGDDAGNGRRCLKRDYGWRRTRIDGTAGAQTWCAWGVLAHNATKISGLINAEDAPEPAKQTNSAPPARRGAGPPGRHRTALAA